MSSKSSSSSSSSQQRGKGKSHRRKKGGGSGGSSGGGGGSLEEAKTNASVDDVQVESDAVDEVVGEEEVAGDDEVGGSAASIDEDDVNYDFNNIINNNKKAAKRVSFAEDLEQHHIIPSPGLSRKNSSTNSNTKRDKRNSSQQQQHQRGKDPIDKYRQLDTVEVFEEPEFEEETPNTTPQQQQRSRSKASSSSSKSSSSASAVAPSTATISTEPTSRDRARERWLFRTQLFYALLAFGISFGVYVKTLYPTSPPGDSAELIVVAHQFGVAHPPGYPLHTLMGYLFLFLSDPIVGGSIAYRLNLMTALCGGLGVSFLCVAAGNYLGASNSVGDNGDSEDNGEGTEKEEREQERRWRQNVHTLMSIGLLSSCMLGFSPTYWLHSIGAEVFALNNLFVGLLLFMLSVFHSSSSSSSKSRDVRWAYAGSFVIGLGLGNQHTLVLAGVPFALWVLFLMGRDRLLGFKSISVLTLCMIAGLSIYVQMLIGCWRLQKSSWGDQRTIEGFIKHLLRQEYGTLRLANSDEEGRFLVNTQYVTSSSLSYSLPTN